MPKRIIKGTGMKSKEFIQYDVNTEGRELSEHFQQLDATFSKATLEQWRSNKGADGMAARRRENAEICRRILRAGGIDPEGDRGMALLDAPDHSREKLAHKWLIDFKRVEKIRKRLIDAGASASDIESLINCSSETGRLQEEMFWRCERDLETGAIRERLALSGRAMSLNGRRNSGTYRKQFQPQREARFERMMELIPAHGVDKAAAIASSENLGTVSAIKKQWNAAVKSGEVPRVRKKKGT